MSQLVRRISEASKIRGEMSCYLFWSLCMTLILNDKCDNHGHRMSLTLGEQANIIPIFGSISVSNIQKTVARFDDFDVIVPQKNR